MVFTNIGTADVTKHAGNGFLATKITFIDEIADLCEKLGADATRYARHRARWPHWLQPSASRTRLRRFVLSENMLALAYTRVAPAYRSLLLAIIAGAISISAGAYELLPSRP
jgi:hypothetical protein